MAEYIFERDDLYVPVATDQTPGTLYDVAEERCGQVLAWGVQTLPDGTGEEWEHAASEAKRINGVRAKAGSISWLDVLLEEVLEAAAEADPHKLRAELVQVAAVAVAWAEDVDRKLAEDAG